MLRTTIYLPDELHTQLKERAFKEKTSMAQLIISSVSVGAFKNITTPKQAVEKILEKKELTFCKHGAAKGLCKFGCV